MKMKLMFLIVLLQTLALPLVHAQSPDDLQEPGILSQMIQSPWVQVPKLFVTTLPPSDLQTMTKDMQESLMGAASKMSGLVNSVKSLIPTTVLAAFVSPVGAQCTCTTEYYCNSGCCSPDPYGYCASLTSCTADLTTCDYKLTQCQQGLPACQVANPQCHARLDPLLQEFNTLSAEVASLQNQVAAAQNVHGGTCHNIGGCVDNLNFTKFGNRTTMTSLECHDIVQGQLSAFPCNVTVGTSCTSGQCPTSSASSSTGSSSLATALTFLYFAEVGYTYLQDAQYYNQLALNVGTEIACMPLQILQCANQQLQSAVDALRKSIPEAAPDIM